MEDTDVLVDLIVSNKKLIIMEILVYFAVFLVIIPILLLLFSALKGMITLKETSKKHY